MTLTDVGTIKCGAGCVAYHKADIRLEPAGDYVTVTVNNDDPYFYSEEGQPIPSYTRRLAAAGVNAFLSDVKRHAEQDRRNKEWPSTGAATIELHLPLNVGLLAGTFAEVRVGNEDYDPLVECIRAFVRKNAQAP